jgi:hypothetical protein
MSRIGDYIIGEQEEGRMEIASENNQEPVLPDDNIILEDHYPIPEQLTDRSDLNTKFGNLPFLKMDQGQSFLLTSMSDKEYVALRARVSRANKKLTGRFALHTESRDDSGISGRVYRVE